MTREKLNQKKQKEIFAEEVKEKRKKIFLITVKILLIITICVALFYCLNTYIFTGKLVVREYRVTSNKIPTEFDGLKIVQFSDLHYGTTVKLPEVKKVVERINYLQPDIVVFTGDLVDKNYKIGIVEKSLIYYRIRENSISRSDYFKQLLVTHYLRKVYKSGNISSNNVIDGLNEYLKKSRYYDEEYRKKFNKSYDVYLCGLNLIRKKKFIKGITTIFNAIVTNKKSILFITNSWNVFIYKFLRQN